MPDALNELLLYMQEAENIDIWAIEQAAKAEPRLF